MGTLTPPRRGGTFGRHSASLHVAEPGRGPVPAAPLISRNAGGARPGPGAGGASLRVPRGRPAPALGLRRCSGRHPDPRTRPRHPVPRPSSTAPPSAGSRRSGPTVGSVGSEPPTVQGSFPGELPGDRPQRRGPLDAPSLGPRVAAPAPPPRAPGPRQPRTCCFTHRLGFLRGGASRLTAPLIVLIFFTLIKYR